MNLPVWVIDTNVLVSAVLSPNGNCDKILRTAAEGRIRLGWSPLILAEYRLVLSRPKFRLSPAIVSTLLSSFAVVDQYDPSEAPKLPDEDDEIFLATALSTPSQVLVTGNSAHFPAKICAPVRVITPAEAAKESKG